MNDGRCFYCCACAQSMCVHPRTRCAFCLAREDGGPAMRDDPEDDNTPFAHPAFWRGQDDGVRGVVMRVRQILDGTDKGEGWLGDPELEAMRRELLALREKAGGL